MSKPSIETQLDNLLKQNAPLLIDQANSRFNQLSKKTGESYLLFGAGRLGQVTLAGLRKAGIEPLAFADNNSQLWGKFVDGLRVLSPEDAISQYGKTSVFIITIYTSQPVWEQLSKFDLNLASFASLAWKYPQALLPHGDLELPDKIYTQSADIRSAFSLWGDDISRQEYLGQLQWRTSLERETLPPHLPQQDIYFPEDIIVPRPDEVFVDCGAFDGDTVQEFIKRRNSTFGKIIAVEPDPENCKNLKARISHLPENLKEQIKILQNAVGSRREVVSFNATGTAASSVGTGTFDVECARLDELISNEHPTYIKMDIEGAETDAVTGAQKLIEKELPVFAICLYHKQEHLWQIPLMIASFSDQYRFFLRRYADECWELVCYAIPVNRLKSKPAENI